MTKNKKPCYKCPRRTATCHADCADYAAFAADRQAEQAVVREVKEDYRATFDARKVYDKLKRRRLKK